MHLSLIPATSRVADDDSDCCETPVIIRINLNMYLRRQAGAQDSVLPLASSLMLRGAVLERMMNQAVAALNSLSFSRLETVFLERLILHSELRHVLMALFPSAGSGQSVTRPDELCHLDSYPQP